MRLTVTIHTDGSADHWSEVAELPGCFASGRTLSELSAGLAEAVGLYLWDEPALIEPAELTPATRTVEVRRRPGAPKTETM